MSINFSGKHAALRREQARGDAEGGGAECNAQLRKRRPATNCEPATLCVQLILKKRGNRKR